MLSLFRAAIACNIAYLVVSHTHRDRGKRASSIERLEQTAKARRSATLRNSLASSLLRMIQALKQNGARIIEEELFDDADHANDVPTIASLKRLRRVFFDLR
jgi:hypothetical protein